MVSLISRIEALSRNPLLASVVLGVQAAHDPDDLGGIRDPMQAPRPDRSHVGEIVLFADAGAPEAAIERCAAGLAGLASVLGWDALTFIGDFAVPLVPSNSEHATAAGARERLAAQGVGDTYDGAIVAPGDTVAAITRDLLTIARHEGAAPDIRFHGSGAASVGSLCRYCNLHLDIYAMDELARIMASMHAAGLSVAPHGCSERFGDGGRIDGRRIDV